MGIEIGVAAAITSIIGTSAVATAAAGIVEGAIIGAVSGGIISGATSELSGGKFKDGFKDGAITGAIGGAVLGGAGELLGAADKVDDAGKLLGAADKADDAAKVVDTAGDVAKAGEMSLGAAGQTQKLADATSGIISGGEPVAQAGGMLGEATTLPPVGNIAEQATQGMATPSYALGGDKAVQGVQGAVKLDQAGGLVKQSGEQASSGGWLDAFLPKSDFAKEAAMTIGGNVLTGVGQAYQQNQLLDEQESQRKRVGKGWATQGNRPYQRATRIYTQGRYSK